MKSSTQNVALYQLSYSQMKTYLLAALFVVGNIALPQLCHLMPQGGLIFLPIYFFTLVAAYKYGLRKDDRIMTMVNTDSHKSYTIHNYTDITDALVNKTNSSASVTFTITFKRDGKVMVKNVKAPVNKETGKYYLGITQPTRKMQGLEPITSTFSQIGSMSLAIFAALEQLVINFAGTVKQMSGPVGIYKITAQVTESGQVANIFYLMALLSVNIGIFNLLPIPGLDGAQTIFAIIEGIIGHELPQNAKYYLQLAGLSLILLLMVVVTYQDILRFMK